MSSRPNLRDRETRAALRRRTVRRRRQVVLLTIAALFAVALVGRTLTSGSGGRAATPRHIARTPRPSSGGLATTATAAGAAPDPAPPAGTRWTNATPWTGAPQTVLVTRVATDTHGDAATVAWFRSSRTQLALYPGTNNPGPTSAGRGPAAVPLTARTTLLATFNSGFYEKDAAAGFYVHNTLYHPMIAGLATVVGYSDGRIDIIRWTGGSRPGPGIVMARQNLTLLVNGRHIAPTAGILSDWGLTWHGGTAVWRSAIGIDRTGNLIYAAGPAQTVAGLAGVLVKAGAVRAMQLDINPEWPILVTFGLPRAHRATLATPNPNQIPSRFLYTSIKDFFAVYLRTTPGATPQPW